MELEDYKYYILDTGQTVYGVVSDDNEIISYLHLRLEIRRNKFSGKDEKVLVADNYQQPVMCLKSKLSDVFNSIDLTTNYWTAWEHKTGLKRKATARNTES